MSADHPTLIHVHAGPVQQAALVLACAPALADHVLTSHADDGSESCVLIQHRADDVPFAMWGSGAQKLWELMLSLTGTPYADGQFTSLYSVLARLDRPNTATVGEALAALCDLR